MVSESLSSSKRRAPCEPKPNVPRPRPLRSRARHPGECAAEKALKPEELCASLVVNGLIKDALKEDVKTATEDVAMAVDDSGDEMEDDVLSLCDQSEAEEETQSVDLACRLAQRVVQEGIHLDITKAVQDASHQSVSTEFEEVSAFSEEEEEDRVLDKEAEAARLEARQTLIQAAQSGRLLTALQEATAAKEAEAARLEARQTLIQAAQSGRLLTALQEATAAKAEMDVAALRQEAKQKLLAAAQDGRLAAAFKSKAEAVEVEPQEPDVESLRREARDTLLKAARDGRLASAFSEMRKAEVEPKEPDVESLRREARDTLLKAARDGRLASAFSETRKEQTKQQDLEVIREKARCALLNTLESGQFQKAMEEIAESRKAAEIQADPVPSLPLSSKMPGRAKRRVIGAVVRAPSESVPVDPSPPDASPTSQLAWFMAGPPSNGLRQKDFAAFNIDNRFDATEPRGLTRKSSITSMFEALGSADLVQMNAKEKVPSRLYSFKPSTPGDLCKARGLAKPGMTSSASAMALDLGLDLASKDRIGTPSMGTRCSSVGSLRSLKANKAKQLPFLGKPQKLDERGSAIDWSVNHVQSVMKKTHSWSTISAASAF